MRKDSLTEKLRVRVRPDQRQHMEKQCEQYGINCSEYFRRLVEQDMGRVNMNQMKTREEFLQEKALIYEINRIGNNINQIVKNVNSKFYTDYEKKKLFAMMETVKTLLSAKINKND